MESTPPHAPKSDAPKSRAFVALPDVAPLIAAAADALARGDFDAALDAHKKALLVIPATDGAARASSLASVGDVKRAQGKAREAESFYEKALDALPGHRRSLDTLIALAAEAHDVRRTVAYRRKLVDSLTDETARVAEIMKLVDLLEGDAQDPKGAAAVLEAARLLAPRNGGLLARLRATYERSNTWAKAMSVVGAQAALATDPTERAALRFTQGDIALGRLRREAEGVEAMELALETDPTHAKALAALEAIRGRHHAWSELAHLYEKLVDAFAKRGDAERAHGACLKLAVVRRDGLRDGPGAIDALIGAITCMPNDADARAQLADLLATKGDTDAALTELEALAVLAPTRAATYDRLCSLHRRGERLDLAWLAALSLDALGAADVDEQLLLDQFRPEGVIRPADVLDDAAWDAHLRMATGDAVVAAIMLAVGPAAVAARVDELRAQKQLLALDPQMKQSKASTVSIVRTFAWASRILGIALPELYVLDNVPGGIAAVQVEAPTTVLGPAVLKGLALPELAFLVGRHLTYYRPEHYALVFYPSLEELTVVFLAAVTAVATGPDHEAVSSHAGDAVARKRKAITKHLTKDARAALAAAVAQLEARGGKADLNAWVRGVELTAGRAGLLLAGDLAMATKRINAENRPVGGLTGDERWRDLLAFCASRRHAALRERLRIGAGSPPSLMPPPGSIPPPASGTVLR